MPTFPTDAKCIFCKIVAGQIPAHTFYEDDAVLAFLDVGPLVPGHALVIPKAHYKNVLDIPPEALAAIALRLPALSRAVTAAVGALACHILLNNGEEAMQSVHHLHCHILPRRNGDTFRIPWNAGRLDSTQAQKWVAGMKEMLSKA